MSEKKAKLKRAQQPQPNPQQQTIPVEQALQMQSAKVGMLILQIDIITQQMVALETENNQLKEQLKTKK